MDENELKELLAGKNPEFKQVVEEHRLCEKTIEELSRKSFLTDQERVEEKTLKKRKLVLKDKMYRMMAEYKDSR